MTVQPVPTGRDIRTIRSYRDKMELSMYHEFNQRSICPRRPNWLTVWKGVPWAKRGKTALVELIPTKLSVAGEQGLQPSQTCVSTTRPSEVVVVSEDPSGLLQTTPHATTSSIIPATIIPKGPNGPPRLRIVMICGHCLIILIVTTRRMSDPSTAKLSEAYR